MQGIETTVAQSVSTLMSGKTIDDFSKFGKHAEIMRMVADKVSGMKPEDRKSREDVLRAIRKSNRCRDFHQLLCDHYDERSSETFTPVTDEIAIPQLDFGLLDPSLAQGACPWLDEYVAFSKKWSPRGPAIHHIGCGLWVLSTVTARRLAARDGRTAQYTPLYIQLVAPSTVWGKSTTARIATDLIKRAGLGWLLCPDSSTPEKLIKNMAGKEVPENYADLDSNQQEWTRLKLAHSGQRGWYYSEFGQLMREMADSRSRNAAFKQILLRMDDCERTYQYDTIGRNLEEAELPYLSLLGTMTPNCMKPYSSSDASSWNDGFYARFAFCCVPLNAQKTEADLRREQYPDQYPDDDPHFPTTILKPIEDFHQRLGTRQCSIIENTGDRTGTYKVNKGPMDEYPVKTLKLNRDAKDALNDYGIALALISQKPCLAQFQSYYSRLRDKTLRIATMFAGEQDSPQIELRHIAGAQQIAEKFRLGVHQLSVHLSQSSEQRMDAKIIEVLTKRGSLTAREIGQYTNSDTNSAAIEIDVLMNDGTIISTKQGRKTVYSIAPKEV